jgi:tetratricopeptide (TPR) repeat protein
MILRTFICAVALALMATGVQARRVALVIGQSAYPGSISVGAAELRTLPNPRQDATRMAQLLEQHGFEVIACDGTILGCFDLDHRQLLDALTTLERRAAGADLALLFFAGHGLDSQEGNVLAPVDAKFDCSTGAVSNGVVLEHIMRATKPASHALVILDASRDNPLGDACPNLQGKKLAFTRIRPGTMRSFLLVSSTQFGQQALDGPPGLHSPFARALLSTLEANPAISFDQVMHEVARATHVAARKQNGFFQIPVQVLGREAPANCLAGKDCIGDTRMAALAAENARLAADVASVRQLLAIQEHTRGKPYTLQEFQKRAAELERTLAHIRVNTDPPGQGSSRQIDSGHAAGEHAKSGDARDADEMTLATEPAVTIAEPAPKPDPDPDKAGRQRDLAGSHDKVDGVLVRQGSLPAALDEHLASFAIAARLARSDPGNADRQRDLAIALEKIGDALVEQGNLLAALDNFRASHTIANRLAQADPSNVERQLDLALAYEKIGNVLVDRGNLLAALDNFRASHTIADRLAKTDPSNAGWQLDVAISHDKIGDVLAEQNKLPVALASYRASLQIFDRLAKADPNNAGGQLLLALSHTKIGDLLRSQGHLSAALDNYRTALAITERLANGDLGNSSWQRDLALSHARIALLLARQGLRRDAVTAFKRGHAIILRLRQLSPGDASLSRNLAWFEERLAELKK